MRRLFLLLPALFGLAGCQFYEEHIVGTAPAPATTAPAGPVSLHLATFRTPVDKDDNWLRITRDYPQVGQYPPRVIAVPDLAYTRIYELLIDGVPGAEAASLCADMMAHNQYCAIQLAASPPPATGVTSETTTTVVTPPPPPPVGSAPLP